MEIENQPPPTEAGREYRSRPEQHDEAANGTRVESRAAAEPAALFFHQLRSYDRRYQELGGRWRI